VLPRAQFHLLTENKPLKRRGGVVGGRWEKEREGGKELTGFYSLAL